MQSSVVIIGAGPAGLTAAHECLNKNLHPVLFEKCGQVGGIARTELYKGCRFDIGGHRFFTYFEEIQHFWEDLLQKDFLKVPRISRIYYKKRFYKYPLSFCNAISNLGVMEGLLILFSYIKAKMQPQAPEDTFENWVIHRFGRRLYQTFFKTYTEKVWGIPCSEIQSDWAAQRIKGLSLRSVLYEALIGSSNSDAKTLIREFNYPALGPGMMWHSLQKRIEDQGGEIYLKSEAVRMQWTANRIKSVSVKQDGKVINHNVESLISSIPLDELICSLDPPPPEQVLDAAGRLRYRDFILVGLILKKARLFPDNWIYIHSPDVKVGRIQNFKNWSPAMVPNPAKTSLGMEYFCSKGDTIWNTPDEELIQLAKQELEILGLASSVAAVDGIVFRQLKAYPVYDSDYRRNIEIIRRFLGTIENLQTVGRNGLHRYNNQDHSMITAKLAIGNLLGQSNDIWAANTEPTYFE